MKQVRVKVFIMSLLLSILFVHTMPTALASTEDLDTSDYLSHFELVRGKTYQYFPLIELYKPYVEKPYTLETTLPVFVYGFGGINPIALSLDVDDSKNSGLFMTTPSDSVSVAIMKYKVNVLDWDSVSEWAKPAVKYISARSILPVDWYGDTVPEAMGVSDKMRFEIVITTSMETSLGTTPEIREYIPQFYFHPKESASRASFCSLLQSLVMSTSHRSLSQFALEYMYALPPNINPSSWYAPAVSWCLANGLVVATGVNEYDAAGYVTRLELCYGLYAMMQSLGVPLPQRDVELGFADENKIPDYYRSVVDAVTWAGIMVGDDAHNFRPYDPVTREEMSVAFYNGITWYLTNHPSFRDLVKEEESIIEY